MAAFLFDRQNKKEVEVEVVLELSVDDFAKAQADWEELKYAARTTAEGLDESVDWNWAGKFAGRGRDHRFLGIEFDGRMQGLMQVTVGFQAVGQKKNLREKVVYIDHLETAPWNQGRYTGSGNELFAQVGTCLIGAAGQLSKIAGFGGRLGLHSLPDAVGFYRILKLNGHLVFTELGFGYAPYSALDYFEAL